MRRVPSKSPGLVWHATPLDNVPSILRAASLRFREGKNRVRHPGAATPKSRYRRRRLEAVYFSLEPDTPFLRHHVQLGISMVLFGFDLLGRANDKAGLVRVNGKAWAHRDDFQPIRDLNQWELLLEQWETGLCRSLEFVIEDDVPLDRSWKVVAYPVAAESLLADWMRGSVDQNNEWQPIRLPRNRRSGLGCTSRIPSGYVWFERCSGPTRSSPAALGAPESGQPGDHNATVPLPIGPGP